MPGALRQADDFFQHYELVKLVEWLNSVPEANELQDKIQFEAMARKAGLPAAQIVATIINQSIAFQVPSGFPQQDLFSKANNKYGGEGCQLWRFDRASKTWSNGNGAKNQQELIASLVGESPEASFLIQRSYQNNAFMGKLSSGALCTIRIVTSKLPGEHPKFFRSAVLMPVGGQVVDNFAKGSLAAGIDDTGHLIQATKLADHGAPIDKHPDTGQIIAGLKLEGWEEAVDLALAAHAKITDVPTVGWDVALTPEGTILLEANVGWGGNVLQIPGSRPLGRAFSDMFLTVAEQKLRDEGWQI